MAVAEVIGEGGRGGGGRPWLGRNGTVFAAMREAWLMAKPIKRYAEPPPREPRDHVEFERFIRDLDSGEIPPCQPREPNSNGTEYR